jgi:hypothetical protein
MKLTDNSVARLKPAARGECYPVRDDDLPGFHVRVSHKHKICKLALDVRVEGSAKPVAGRGKQSSSRSRQRARQQ